MSLNKLDINMHRFARLLAVTFKNYRPQYGDFFLSKFILTMFEKPFIEI